MNRGQEMPFLLAATPSVNVQSDSGIDGRLRLLQRARHRPDAPQHDPRRRPAAGPRGPGALLLELRRLRERRRLDPGPARRRHLERRGRVLRRLGELRERQPRREGRARGAGGRRLVGDRARARSAGSSGRLGPLRASTAALAAQTSDGFREHSGVDQHTVYFGAHASGRALALQALRLLRPREEPARVPRHRAGDARDRTCAQNDLSPDEKDDFGQDVVQLQYTRLVGASSTLMAQGYYNGAQGWFRHPRRGERGPPAVRHRRPLRRPRARGHAPAGAGSASTGAPTPTTSPATTSWTWSAARAPTPNTGLKNEYSTFLKATWDARPGPALGRRAGPPRALRVPRRPAARLA